MKKHNRIVLDLGKVQYARFRYRNQCGQTRDIKPDSSHFTINNIMYSKSELALWHPEFPGEFLYTRAKRRDCLDIWIPEVYFQLTANHSLVYTGKKATALWKEWNRRIFKKT